MTLPASPNPSISVITPCLNGARYIGEAIDSVVSQGCADAEHIVADGGSTDGTLDILASHPHLKFQSAPDQGMYDALNGALARARGGVIGILNCDDCYAEDVFLPILELFRDDSVMAVAGRAATFRIDTAPAGDALTAAPAAAGGDATFRSTLGDPSINAWFFRASVFERIGGFDAAYRIAGDREFMLRFALSGLRYVDTDRLICRYRAHAGSATFGGNEEIWHAILREHGRMTGHYLASAVVPGPARDLIKRARIRDTLSGALYSVSRHDLRQALWYAAAGTRFDPVWPARFARRAFGVLARKLGLRDERGRVS